MYLLIYSTTYTYFFIFNLYCVVEYNIGTQLVKLVMYK